MAPKRRGIDREEKLENLVKNQSMIMMGMFEEGLSDVAEMLTSAMTAGASAIAEALGGQEAREQVKKEIAPVPPRIRTEIEAAFSDIREEIGSQWPKNPKVFTRYVSSPAFDKGIEIVESYDFKRPRLTEDLNDTMLASYVFLMKSGDKQLIKMFKELGEWQKGLPQPPWTT